MNVSINPSYKCNFRCPSCYLTNDQLKDSTTLDLSVIEQRLDEVARQYEIETIDLYGGEVGLLPLAYLSEIKNLASRYTSDPLNVITNLSVVSDFFLDPDIQLSVSFDFESRPQWYTVLNNMAMMPRDMSVLILANEEVINRSVEDSINMMNALSNVHSVEIKPYSSNQSNQQNVTHSDFEEFVRKWVQYPNKQFEFVNEAKIRESLNKTYNAFSDDHVYITPTGKYGVLEFDLNDNEFFKEMDTIEQYKDWVSVERARVENNQYCKQCKHLGHCLTEHLRNVTNMTNSCNGYYELLEWYDRERI
jgi:sulfatase maturation enzyme AslB (radical SAM superfamily)